MDADAVIARALALLTPSLPGDIAADAKALGMFAWAATIAATFNAPVFVIQRTRHRQRRNPQVTYEALQADNGAWLRHQLRDDSRARQVDGLLGLVLPDGTRRYAPDRAAALRAVVETGPM